MKKLFILVLLLFLTACGASNSSSEYDDLDSDEFDAVEMDYTGKYPFIQCFYEEETDSIIDSYYTSSHRIWVFQDPNTYKMLKGSSYTVITIVNLDLTDEEKANLNKFAQEKYCSDYDKEVYDTCFAKLEESSLANDYNLRIKYIYNIDNFAETFGQDKDALNKFRNYLEDEKGFDC